MSDTNLDEYVSQLQAMDAAMADNHDHELTPVAMLEAPTAAEWLAEVDPTLAALFDQLDERLRVAQDEERDSHPPIDWTTEQDRLAEQQIALLITAGNAIDQIMSIGELGVFVARHAAGIDAAYRMQVANAPTTHQRALPPPDDFDDSSDPGGGNGGDGDPEKPHEFDELAGIHRARTVELNRLPQPPDTDEGERYERLRLQHERWMDGDTVVVEARMVGSWWQRFHTNARRWRALGWATAVVLGPILLGTT